MSRPETINGWAIANQHGAVFPETTRRTKRECIADIRATHRAIQNRDVPWSELQALGLYAIRVMLRPIYDGRAVSADRLRTPDDGGR